jgi:hypothetical protein
VNGLLGLNLGKLQRTYLSTIIVVTVVNSGKTTSHRQYRRCLGSQTARMVMVRLPRVQVVGVACPVGNICRTPRVRVTSTAGPLLTVSLRSTKRARLSRPRTISSAARRGRPGPIIYSGIKPNRLADSLRSIERPCIAPCRRAMHQHAHGSTKPELRLLQVLPNNGHSTTDTQRAEST